MRALIILRIGEVRLRAEAEEQILGVAESRGGVRIRDLALVTSPSARPSASGARRAARRSILAVMIDEDRGGDDACWLSKVCPECGAMLEDRVSPCWRCGIDPDGEA